ncbi:MAG: 4Fe-4S binding protein [Deltaproteobacteria bacterium]|nr:4Fe-4S binding protein [Deltaproteobacteria bacterium]
MTIASINYDTCIGCGECELSCPMDVIRMDTEGEKPVIKFPEDCQTCKLCEFFCPEEGTITVSPYKCDRPIVGWG